MARLGIGRFVEPKFYNKKCGQATHWPLIINTCFHTGYQNTRVKLCQEKGPGRQNGFYRFQLHIALKFRMIFHMINSFIMPSVTHHLSVASYLLFSLTLGLVYFSFTSGYITLLERILGCFSFDDTKIISRLPSKAIEKLSWTSPREV